MLAEIVIKAECYIKGQESNVEKKAHDFKDRVPDTGSSHPSRKNSYISSVKDKSMFKKVGNAIESFTPLNSH